MDTLKCLTNIILVISVLLFCPKVFECRLPTIASTNNTNSSYFNRCQYTINDTINCSFGFGEVDIQSIFLDLEKDLRPEQRRFKQLYWTLPIKNKTLPENVFRNISFNKVTMMTPLERIHSNAFSSTNYGFSWDNRVCGASSLCNKSKLRNYPHTDYDIYKAFIQIKNPEFLYIDLDSEISHDIPDDAFKNNKWTNINTIEFHGDYTISRIGNNLTRHLPKSFQNLRFSLTKSLFDTTPSISKIEPDAFQVEPCLWCPVLTIDLSSVHLTDDVLVEGVFNITGRPIFLNLG